MAKLPRTCSDRPVLAHVVFIQSNEPALPPLAAHAHAHFDATVAVRQDAVDGAACRVTFASPAGAGEFHVVSRPATEEDRERARAAELRGPAPGMGALAARCPRVLVVDAGGDAVSPALLLEFCALLAAVGLGPVLPDDGATLLGVRSARERAARMAEGR